MELKDRIKAARERARLTRAKLAKRLEPSVTYETVRSWEAAASEPKKHNYLQQIAEVTGVRYKWLSVEAGPMIEGEAENITPAEVAKRVREMSRGERMVWLQEIAEAERQDSGTA